MDDLVAAYADAEAWLLRLVADAVERGALGTADRYQDQLDAVQVLLRQADRYLKSMEAGMFEGVALAMDDAYAVGVGQAVASISSPVVPTAAVSALTAETAVALASQRPMILRSVNDAYRQIMQTVTIRAATSGMAIDTSMQQALDKFATRGITSFMDKSGRRWSMDSYTRMAVRTAQNRATNQARTETFQANNIDLIQTSWHRAPAPVCEPYQGQILALTGIAGPREVEDRVNGGTLTIDVTATLADAEAAGYHHPNCGHIDTAYIPGMPIQEAPEIPEGEYEESQRQRAIERHIREWKKREAVAVTPQAKAQAKTKVKAWQAAQRAHLKRNPFLRRNYSRERLFTGNAANALARPIPTTPKPIPTPPPVPPTPASTPTSFYQQQIRLPSNVEVGGAKRGYVLGSLPRTTNTNWESITTRANPGHGLSRDYGVNCVRVANTVELRRRGYDITAGPKMYDPAYGTASTQAFLRGVVNERMETTPKNRKVSVSNSDVAMTAWRTEDGAVRIPQSAKGAKKGVKGGQNAATVDMFKEGVPEGATGFANGSWKRGGAHIWNWVKEGGEIKFFEAQTHKGFVEVESYADRLKAGTLAMVRVDDLIPNDDVLRVVDYDADRSF